MIEAAPPYINGELVDRLKELLELAESGQLLSMQYLIWTLGDELDTDFVAAPDHDIARVLPELDLQLLEMKLSTLSQDPNSVLYLDDE